MKSPLSNEESLRRQPQAFEDVEIPTPHTPLTLSPPRLANKSKLLEAALGYAAKGKPVFPCNLAKKPLTEHGHKDASTD